MDPDTKRCRQCGTHLDAFEGHVLSCTMGAIPGFNMPSGELGCYCDECYDEQTTML